MNRDLKKFVTENRAAFDHAHPPKDLWERISNDLEKHEKPIAQTAVRKMFIRVLKVAAVTFLIGTAGILVYFYGKKNAYEDYSRINPDLAAVQQTYSQLVVQKKDSVAIFAANNPSLYGEFSKALDQMEANYEMLKQEFATSPNKELTLEAMIRNLQAQIEVLSQQMEILNYINTNKNQPQDEQI
ncbi:hypothetical protein ACFQRK_00740 [Parapedobacter sp. GCM10030251]|uniref:hypothetical protein n=1 Tax=Parapedobacter sp. GCM10030251 TaxID=3273419 RepID=UPI003614CAC9